MNYNILYLSKYNIVFSLIITIIILLGCNTERHPSAILDIVYNDCDNYNKYENILLIYFNNSSCFSCFDNVSRALLSQDYNRTKDFLVYAAKDTNGMSIGIRRNGIESNCNVIIDPILANKISNPTQDLLTTKMIINEE